MLGRGARSTPARRFVMPERATTQRKSRCPVAHGRPEEPAQAPPEILSRPVSRRAVLRGTGAIAGAVGTLALLEGLAVLPERVASAEPRALPDIQFDIAPFMPAAQTIDRVPIAL